MPIIKSAKKRVKVAKKASVRNSKTKRTLRAALKSFHASVKSGKASSDSHSKAQSALDTAGKKGVMHKNKVARKKKQLAKTAKASATKPATKTTAKKAPVKKVVAKKAPVKKVTKK